MNLIKLLSISIFLLGAWMSQAQVRYEGKVLTNEGEPLIGATIYVQNTTNGTISGASGDFSLMASEGESLIISFVGFANDTIMLTKERYLEIALKEDAGEMAAVIIASESTMIDDLEPRQSEIILEAELLKAACCNLSESFETNASVDVSFTDAVSGAKTIQMLGLDGRFVQINRENIPLVRGLSSRFGLSYVPGTWIQSIDVGKGAGSVVNGFESMTGQINLEFKKPEINDKLYLNSYFNSFGKAELNYNQSFELNEKWDMGLMTHFDYLNNAVDNNDDGFLDVPRTRQINILNRYKYQSDRLVSQVGLHYMIDQKAGGQNTFGFSDDALSAPVFGFSNTTKKMEIFGKTGLLFPRTPYRGWGFIYSLSHQEITANFGRQPYTGKETTGYFNVINQNIISNSFHQYKTGVSFLLDDFDESLGDSTFQRTEIVPGTFFEYSYLPSDAFSLVAGARLDQHNLYGTYLTPRLHLRYQWNTHSTLRASIGRGYRTPNVIAENMRFLFSSRDFFIEEAITPEVAWNMGGSLVNTFEIREKTARVVIDYFHTRFENQMIIDLDRNSSQVAIYNLDGRSFAHSLQVETFYPIGEKVEVKGAYKFYDVRATINDQLMQVPFIAKHRFFLNGSYATRYDKWKADATLNWIGTKRLPATSDKPQGFQSDDLSPSFFLVSGQVSRGFRWGNIYIGVENALNFKQEAPIIGADDPFGNNFDGSLVWGPIAGRLIYTGFRYRIK